ncbi:MAG TPA: hypothetical protein VJ596_08155 [Gemmatimonadaceae bacterium]|nr:hypothetical protein [Gemmatimonadaceae bacterium]
MRVALTAAALLLCVVTPAHGQRDTTTRSDSAARADSIAREDSIRIVRELERIRNEPRARPEGAPAPTGAQPGISLLPNISAVGEVMADFSPDGSTQESGRRFDVREVELAVQAAVDPYFRGDFFFGISDLEGFAIEEAYLSTIALPWQLQARAGRFHLPLGKQNVIHRPELLTIDYPYVIRRLLGEEGGKGTGLWLSKIFSPFGFYQEIIATAVDALPPDAEHGHEEDEGGGELVVDEPANKRLSGLGYGLRLRNYWDITQAANLEISGSFATGRRPQPIACAAPLAPGDPPAFTDDCPGFDGPPGVNARQGIIGADVTFRWRPLQQGLYRSFIVQAELIHQLNEAAPDLPEIPGQTVGYFGPTDDLTGAYIFARYQLQRRWFVGARYDWLEDPELGGETLSAVSGYLHFFPSEFSKIALGVERTMPSGDRDGITRLLVQATFAVGPHRPHAF